jgi:uncharacterized membrane protein YdjX (TVP38/TMEM64 family)
MKKAVLLALAVAAAVAFFAFDLGRFLDLDYLKAQYAALQTAVAAHPLVASALYFVVYVVIAALSLPGAAVRTVAGGAIFRLLWGSLLVSFASTLGATLAFLLSRFLLRDAVRQRFGERIKAIDAACGAKAAFTYSPCA